MVETHLSQRKDEEKGGEKQPTATAGADSAKLQTSDPYETFGYEVFPERDTTKSRVKQRSFWRTAWDYATGREAKSLIRSVSCQHKVIQCVEDNLMVKLLINALKTKGCKFELSRHVSCEPCNSFANGGYDGINRQVVVCSNNTTKRHTTCNVLAHELIHAFDDCRAKVDFSNLDHVACTEIRAANLMHCNMLSAAGESTANPWGKREQQRCVRWKARNSVLAVRNVSKEEADAAVDRVFNKCYPDLEPIGRVPRNPYIDGRRIYVEASLYGYTELTPEVGHTART